MIYRDVINSIKRRFDASSIILETEALALTGNSLFLAAKLSHP